ncbi:MAG TPA: beta-ketoacyl synthase chain length factor [Xanthomonadaceae bacterium]|nr:beta-ketoacyl synthase chain length factor [Xanthomonadaceae bacterium]
MTALNARIAGIGFWCNGLPSWQAARDFVANRALPSEPPAKPQPQLLAPNERRRAPESVAVALEVALAACTDAGLDPATLPSVFASTHGDLAITDYMCATLATDPAALSPTRFHNSVHNAAAGYWTIGNGCTAATTAISAFDASFAQGLLEALSQLAAGEEAVLLAAYDTTAVGPAATLWASTGLLGGALVLARTGAGPRLTATLGEGRVSTATGPLAAHGAGNAMAPMLPLLDALAAHAPGAILHAGPGRVLRVELQHD